MALLLSNEELETLRGLPDFQKCLYIFGIRRYMDYQTGVVGIKRKISHQSLAEETYIEPIKGVKQTGSKSRQQVRRAVKALEKSGLIHIKSSRQQLILECLLARSDKSVQNKADTFPTQLADTKADTLNNQKNSVNTDIKHESEQESRHIGRHTENKKADMPPISGKDSSDDDEADFSTQGIFGPFLELISQQGFPLHMVMGNVKTTLMIKAWVDKGVTLEQAETGIKEANAYLGERPATPQFYLQRVLQVKQSMDKMNQKVSGGNNAKSHNYKSQRSAVKRAKDWLEKQQRESGEASDDEAF
jgi:hypothetical protein